MGVELVMPTEIAWEALLGVGKKRKRGEDQVILEEIEKQVRRVYHPELDALVSAL